MSLIGRLKNMLVEKFVEDEFYQPISEAEVYAILHQKGVYSLTHPLLKLPRATSSQEIPDALALAESVAHHTPELQFRLLGYEPSLEQIAGKMGVLKAKLQIIDEYILGHYEDYQSSVGSSMAGFDEGRQFYATRRKVGEARFMLEKMSKLLSRSKTITRLNITIKNLKNTLKLLEKVPNIKKMGLVELKAIDLARLQRTNSQVSTVYGGRLLCLTNLSKYILKVNQESFNYIINNIKMCFDSFDDHLYEEVMRSYLIIQPPVALDQLLASFLEERVRTVLLESNDALPVIGNRLIGLMINLHKIIKWHIINRALKSNKPIGQTEAEPQRRLSVSSNNSQDAPTTIELGDIVYISLEGIKETFNRSVDSYLTDFASDNILSLQLENKEIYMQLQILARIGEICSNFTGKRLEKLRKAFIEYFNRKEAALYAKSSRQFVTSIEQERCDWNRLPFPNNFRFVPIDRLLYRWSRMQELDDHRKISLSVNRLFLEQLVESRQREDDQDSSEEEALELKVIKMESSERLQKRFDEWSPKGYLSLYEGDAIVSQSSYKLLGVLQRYTEFLIYAPSSRHCSYLEHMLLLIEYMAFFIFSSLLSAKYRSLFFEPTRTDTPLEKAYTLKRFRTLYPHLAAFANSFRSNLESAQVHTQTGRFLAAFRKQIREVNGEENQALRAKIVAIDSCKYCLAYFHQILKTSEATSSEGGKVIQSRVEVVKNILHDLSTLLLTESCQNILSIELQTIRSLFQSIRWYESYEDLREYVHKIAGIVRESLQRLKGCHRGEVPMSRLHLVFVFIWRTILTYSVKLFLEGKGNNRRDNKLNFQKYVDDLYLAFDPLSFPTLPNAYAVFKSIFRILLSSDWEECRDLLVETLRKFDYIYPILLSILENSEHMATLSQKQKETRRGELRQEIELLLREGK